MVSPRSLIMSNADALHKGFIIVINCCRYCKGQYEAMKKVKYRQNVTWNYGDGSAASGRGDYYLKMPHVSTIYNKSLNKNFEINKLAP